MENKNIIIGYIYKIQNNINDKLYIGQTKSQRIKHGKIINFDIFNRFNEHKQNYNKKKYSNRKLYKAMNEHGIENFTIILLEDIYNDLNILDLKELEYIKKYNSIENGYNETYFNNRYTSCNNIKRINKIKKSMKDKWKNDIKYQKLTKEKNLEAVIKRANNGKTRKEENKNLPSNIYNHTRNDNKIGYDIRIYRDKKYKITSVTKNISNIDINNKEEILKELLEKAINKKTLLLNEFNNNTTAQNIINENNEKLVNNNNIDSKIKIIINKQINKKVRSKKKDHNNNNLPMYLNNVRYRNNDGYEILIKNKNFKIKKTFTNSYLSMDEKLNNAKKELQKILIEINGQSAGET